MNENTKYNRTSLYKDDSNTATRFYFHLITHPGYTVNEFLEQDQRVHNAGDRIKIWQSYTIPTEKPVGVPAEAYCFGIQ
jgi:hypothetical protein